MKIQGKADKVYNEVCEYLEKCRDKDVIVFISNKETKEMRTVYQNDMFYGLFTEIGKHYGLTKEEIKQNTLKGVFGTKKVECGIFTSEEAIKPSTSQLNKDEAIYFIESLMKLITAHKIPCKYSNADFKNLCETYS